MNNQISCQQHHKKDECHYTKNLSFVPNGIIKKVPVKKELELPVAQVKI